MISTNNISKAKHLLSKASHPRILLSQDEKFNRTALSKLKFDILLSPESSTGRSKIKKIDSGLNHVLAKLANKNKIAIGIDLSNLRKLPKKDKALQLEKIRKNIQLARKYKVKLALLNSKEQKDARSLLTSLGSSSQQAKQAFIN